MDESLIFDLGMNNGDDSDFYLKKGFRVVGVEANSQLCTACEARFSAQIAAGRLTIVNRAVAAHPGEVVLFVNENMSGWSTIEPRWRETRTRARTRTFAVTVPAVTVDELVRDHGAPYYIKADIQGAEILFLESLLTVAERPQHVSLSAGTDVLRSGAYGHISRQMELLRRLGYRKFKILAQRGTRWQSCPRPALEGRYVEHEFQPLSSGLFGRELPGHWLDAEAALAEHRRIVRAYRFAGHSRSPAGWFTGLTNERVKRGLDRIFWRGLDWYDTHATR